MVLLVLSALIREARALLEGRPQSAAVAVEDGGKILLLKRGKTAPWMPGKWNLPGGGTDEGEGPEQAARREAAEEAGIRVGKMKLLKKVNLGREIGDVFFFHSTQYSGKVKINWESDAFRWVPKDEAVNYPLVPGIKPALMQLVKEGLGEKSDKKTWRREKLYGADVVFQPKVSPKAEEHVVGQLQHAYKILKAMRFGDAWGGTFIVMGKGYKPPFPGLRGNYNRKTDETWLWERVGKKTIIHELGHRWWYRNMTRPNRLRFIDWVKKGLSPVSAYAKKDPWEAFAEAFTYFVLGKRMTPQQIETFKLVARGGRFENLDEVRGPDIAVFDFDGTLFKSPPPPPWWDRSTVWWHDPESLNPPCVPQKPGGDWWNGRLVNYAREKVSDPKCHTVLLTGRNHRLFAKRVKELLKQQGLNFDEILLNPGTSTLPFKSGVLKRLSNHPKAQFVELWDDHPRYTRKFQSQFDKHGIKFSIKNTATLSHPAVCKTPPEE